jgi:hypothetical protein
MKRALLTFDWDWAPDFVVEPIIDFLIVKQIPAIWFVTHETILLDKLRDNRNIFELGIHPNFFKNSTQGSSEDEIVENLLEIVPEARSIRTHGLYQYSNLLLKFGSEYGLIYDFSIFLPKTSIRVHDFIFENKKITRLPYNWEDDIAMFDSGGIEASYNYITHFDDCIFDFHPIHVALNSSNLEIYKRLKSLYPNMSDWNKSILQDYKSNVQVGPGNILRKLVDDHYQKIIHLDKFLNSKK